MNYNVTPLHEDIAKKIVGYRDSPELNAAAVEYWANYLAKCFPARPQSKSVSHPADKYGFDQINFETPVYCPVDIDSVKWKRALRAYAHRHKLHIAIRKNKEGREVALKLNWGD